MSTCKITTNFKSPHQNDQKRTDSSSITHLQSDLDLQLSNRLTSTIDAVLLNLKSINNKCLRLEAALASVHALLLEPEDDQSSEEDSHVSEESIESPSPVPLPKNVKVKRA